MYEITLSKRKEVVRMFFQGVSYDAIARRLGIGKGSVVNIIEEFREGDLAIPSDMTEYVDALRKTAVDVGKHNTSISQVMTCARIHAKLMDMGVDVEKAEQWIDTCQEITSTGASGNELVNAAMELVQLKSETGLSNRDLITDYKTKKNERDELHEEIEQENVTHAQVKYEHKKEKEKVTRELESIIMAMATSQELFQKHKDSLTSELDTYLTQNKLSWEQVNLTLALFDSALGKSGTPEQATDQLTERIRHTGSLVKVNKQLEQEKVRLQSEATALVQEEQRSTETINKLRESDKYFRASISANIAKSEELITGLESKSVELEELKETTSNYAHKLYIAHLIIDFLFVPGSLNNYDLDQLVSLMIGLRQKRLGIEPKQVKDANGNVICECQVPRTSRTVRLPEKTIDNIRADFAQMLSPLVKDRFVLRHDYDMAVMKYEHDKKLAFLTGIMEERTRKPVW